MSALVFTLLSFLACAIASSNYGPTPDAGQQPTSFYVYTTVQPVLSPDNSVFQIKALIDSAQSTIDVTNQYFYLWSANSWAQDNHPILFSLVNAYNRGVTIRVVLAGDDIDDDKAGPFLASLGISVKYLSPDAGQNYNHNKGVVVDGNKVLVSSINYSKGAMTSNREAGVIVSDPTIAAFYEKAFNYDWSVGIAVSADEISQPSYKLATNYKSVVVAPFTGYVNITCWVNPDNGYAYTYVMNQLNNIQFSLHAEMYEWNLVAAATAIANRLQAVNNLDVTLLISYRRAASDNTVAQYTTVYNAGANVLLSSHTFSYQHAKFWVIDDQYTTVFSGNWDGTSLTGVGAGSAPNREWGITFDSACIAAYFKSVINADRQIASLPSGFQQYCASYDECGDCTADTTTSVAARCDPGPQFDACGICEGSNTNANQCPPAPVSSVSPVADFGGALNPHNNHKQNRTQGHKAKHNGGN